MVKALFALFRVALAITPPAWGGGPQTLEPPLISTLLKPQLLKKVMGDLEVVVHATLDGLENAPSNAPLKKYSIYASMLVRSSVREAYAALTNYRLYPQLVPFIESADFSPITHMLLLEGGIWHFRLSSQIRFEEHLGRWIHFDVVDGHFTGLSGNIYFESKGERGTLVYFSGEKAGVMWPPKFVIERGAEVVFGFTAQRMRSYIESTKKVEQGARHGDEKQGQTQGQIPEPRSRL